MDEPTKREKLGAELAAARGKITGHAAALRQEWNLGARLKTSVASHRLAWVAGAAVLGLLLSKIPPFRREVVVEVPRFGFAKPPEKEKVGMLRRLLKIGFDLSQPALVFWAKRRWFSHDDKDTRG